MRLIIAECSVEYGGRLSTRLPRARRLIMLKSDGSFLVHADDGSYKPLNWILAPCTLSIITKAHYAWPDKYTAAKIDGTAEERPKSPITGISRPNADKASNQTTQAITSAKDEEPQEIWRITHAKTVDTLVISIYKIISDISFELGTEPGLQKDGVELDLQKLLAQQIHLVGEGCTLISREYPTSFGPVDILAKGKDGSILAVEIKRKADIDGVDQLTRYVEQLNKNPILKPVKGILAAQAFAPRARILAKQRSIQCLTLDYEQMRNITVENNRLF